MMTIEKTLHPALQNSNVPVTDEALQSVFIEEAEEIIERMQSFLAQWETSCENFLILTEVQRELHTLKGAARAIEQETIASFVHDLECIYSVVLEKKINVPSAVIKKIQYSHAALAQLILDYKNDGELVLIKETIDTIELILCTLSPQASIALKSREAFLKQTLLEENKMVDDHFNAVKKNELLRIPATDIETWYHSVHEAGVLHAELLHILKEAQLSSQDFQHGADRVRHFMHHLEQISGAHDTTLDNIPKLPVRHLLHSLNTTFETLFALHEHEKEHLKCMRQQLLLHQHQQHQLQQSLLQAEMQEFSSVLPRLNRVVQDTSKSLEKTVELVVTHKDLLIHRPMLNHLMPVLEHLLRNAIDHGIESIDERQHLKKNPIGKINLTLQVIGNELLIEVADDGKGIAVDAVQEKAIQLGLMHQGEHLSLQQILRFILHRGLSTKREVTQISGRGVGLDVVFTEIKNLHGHLQIDSEAEVGTRMTLRIPYLQVLNRSVMFKVAEEYYAIPLLGIDSIVRISSQDLNHYLGEEKAPYPKEGIDYHLVYLGSLLEESVVPIVPQKHAKELAVLFLRTPDFKVGIVVDSLEGSHEMIQQALPPQLQSLRIFSTAAILGNGKIILTLDAASVAEAAMRTLRSPTFLSSFQSNASNALTAHTNELSLTRTQATILVIDDSVTVCRMISRLLELNGYKVVIAENGIQGLEQLKTIHPSLILLDVDMPRMDGFEFAAALEKNKSFSTIPIIMISSHPLEHYRSALFSPAIKEFLNKPYQEEQLLKAIRAVLMAE